MNKQQTWLTSGNRRKGARGKLQIFNLAYYVFVFTPIAFNFSECANA